MVAVTFDTRKFVKTLKAAGAPEAQAEAFPTAMRDSHEAAELATQQDIGNLRHEICALELRLSGAMKLLKWGMSILIAGVASLIFKTFF